MSKKVTTASLAKLDRRYVQALLHALDNRKRNNKVDPEVYEKLREKYSQALDDAQDKAILYEGFTTVVAIAPDPYAIKESVSNLLKRIQDIDREYRNVEGRFDKLDQILSQGKISKAVHENKKKEYEILLHKIGDQKSVLLDGIPDSLAILQDMNQGITERLEELEADELVLDTPEAKNEKKVLEKIHKEMKSVARKLSKLVKEDYTDSDWELPQAAIQADIKPLQSDVTKTRTPSRDPPPPPPQEPIRPPPRTTVWTKWKNIDIGKLIGEVSLVGGNFAIIATDRPSLAMIRDFATTGPSRLKSASSPKVIEDRLKKMVQDNYGVAEEDALLPENLVNFAIENKIGVDLFRLINSYYASVGKGAINIQDNQAIVNDSAQILTLAENVNLLGRRVLAPDRTLIGVIHELYFQPSSSELYTLAFKGVPPQIIRRIYSDTHTQTMADGTYTAFRNEIAKKLNIPIYEALTPSSIVRYSLLSGLLLNLNQLISLVESMNPRISKAIDIANISNQGALLTRFPQNSLPRIELLKFNQL
ncbi:MAG: hypothetical protein FK733_18865 [Asgard group archaeon]|nr:hypothetical protein [Asgard group archaeon]